jgi:putative hydrolase of the HAD superfamily
MSKIKNIIFDLGGVIINLDILKTISDFNKLSNEAFEAIYTQAHQNPVFDLFDKGLISESEFFFELQRITKSNASINELKKVWNSMLLDFPSNRLELLKKLKPKYRLFLLSNTNETHVTKFENILYNHYQFKNLEPFFEKVYYSCRMKMRKPDSEIFEFVLHENGLNAHETLFIDDSIQHIEGALKTGINAHLLAKEKEVEILLKELNLI